MANRPRGRTMARVRAGRERMMAGRRRRRGSDPVVDRRSRRRRRGRRPPGFAWTTRRGRNCRSTFAPNSWARVGNPREVRKGGTDFLAAWDHLPRGAGFSRSRNVGDRCRRIRRGANPRRRIPRRRVLRRRVPRRRVPRRRVLRRRVLRRRVPVRDRDRRRRRSRDILACAARQRRTRGGCGARVKWRTMSLARVKWRRTSLARSLIPIPIPSRDRDPRNPAPRNPAPQIRTPTAVSRRRTRKSTRTCSRPSGRTSDGVFARTTTKRRDDRERRRRVGASSSERRRTRAREDANRRRRRTVSRGCSPRNHIATERRRFA